MVRPIVGRHVDELLAAFVAQHDRQLVRRRGAAEQIDVAVAVEVAPAEATQFVAAGLGHAQLGADADEHACVVPVQAHLATAERHREIEIAVVVVVAPGVRVRVGDAEQFRLHRREGGRGLARGRDLQQRDGDRGSQEQSLGEVTRHDTRRRWSHGTAILAG